MGIFVWGLCAPNFAGRKFCRTMRVWVWVGCAAFAPPWVVTGRALPACAPRLPPCVGAPIGGLRWWRPLGRIGGDLRVCQRDTPWIPPGGFL